MVRRVHIYLLRCRVNRLVLLVARASIPISLSTISAWHPILDLSLVPLRFETLVFVFGSLFGHSVVCLARPIMTLEASLTLAGMAGDTLPGVRRVTLGADWCFLRLVLRVSHLLNTLLCRW